MASNELKDVDDDTAATDFRQNGILLFLPSSYQCYIKNTESPVLQQCILI